MKPYYELIKESSDMHGHLCAGQVIGVRMAMLGCRLIGLNDPWDDKERKKIIVFMEMDRCASDAISYVTGVKLGKRNLKFYDYGIMAATFLNLEDRSAYRIVSTEESRDLAPTYAIEVEERSAQQLKAYERMPDSILFRVQKVQVKLNEFDLPGPTRRKIVCEICGQVIRDHRETERNGKTICRPCSDECYFSGANEVCWEGMNWAPYPIEKEASRLDCHTNPNSSRLN
jgi:formylmethanofuran dehydrogenase subunit E